jgi:DNA anti-recombination protein RmuC
MADGDRTFTEGEAYALVADHVARETAAANTKVAELTAQNTTLASEKDVLEVRATAAEEKAATAEKALEDHKAEVETQKANEAKRSDRVAKVAEVAPTLKVEGERADRIVAMADADFEEYVNTLREVASANGTQPPAEGTPTGLPRQSAAFQGAPAQGDKPAQSSVKGLFAARAAIAAPQSA